MRTLLFIIIVISLSSCGNVVAPALFKDDSIVKPTSPLLKGKILRVDPFKDRRDIKDHDFLNTRVYSKKVSTS